VHGGFFQGDIFVRIPPGRRASAAIIDGAVTHGSITAAKSSIGKKRAAAATACIEQADLRRLHIDRFQTDRRASLLLRGGLQREWWIAERLKWCPHT